MGFYMMFGTPGGYGLPAGAKSGDSGRPLVLLFWGCFRHGDALLVGFTLSISPRRAYG